mgnify:CR=1 FL=1
MNTTPKVIGISLTLDCYNEAFEDDAGYEVVRILRDLADKLEARGLDKVGLHLLFV